MTATPVLPVTIRNWQDALLIAFSLAIPVAVYWLKNLAERAGRSPSTVEVQRDQIKHLIKCENALRIEIAALQKRALANAVTRARLESQLQTCRTEVDRMLKRLETDV